MFAQERVLNSQPINTVGTNEKQAGEPVCLLKKTRYGRSALSFYFYCGFEPRSGHIWNKPSFACEWSDGFSRDLQFSPHLMIYSETILTGRNHPPHPATSKKIFFLLKIGFFTIFAPIFQHSLTIFSSKFTVKSLGSGQKPREIGKSETHIYEPRHDKTNKVTVRPAKTQISLGNG